MNIGENLMGRLVNEARIKHSFKPENLGKLLIFVEGSTEYNYIDYLKEYYENNKCSPYTDMVIEQINTSGNAKGVYNRAEEFLQDENNSRVYRDYEKHLVFDCDAPEDIQEVINLMLESENNYILDYSNLLFETWLLMHFYEVLPDENNDKRNIIHEIADALCLTYYGTSEKADPGTIKKILATDGNLTINISYTVCNFN